MSKDGGRPRNVQFVDVGGREGKPERPAWLGGTEGPARAPDYPVRPLLPPEVPSHARPPLAPRLESVRPPAMRPPSQFPGPAARSPSVAPGYASEPPGPPRRPSQFPPAGLSQHPVAGNAALASQFPPPPDLGADSGIGSAVRRRDTFVEDLVPRAEEEAVAAIAAAVQEYAAARTQQLEQAEQDLVELVKVICRRVVLREVTLSSSVVEALVREGLMALGGGDKVIVRLGPFFADALDHISENLHQQGISCNVVIDPSVGAHGCALETELGRVDESVETRLSVLLSNLDTVP